VFDRSTGLITPARLHRVSTATISLQRRERLATARLYLVCDATPGGRPLAPVLRQASLGGVDAVQLRDKSLDDDELLELTRAARPLCDELGLLLIVNDRPLVALHGRADGVHVGQDDEDVPAVRAIVGEDMLIGLSTHTPAEIDGAKGVDYIGVGPVHATPTKPGRPAVGLALVKHAAAHADVPFFAIGGIDAGNLDAVLGAGARRVAVVRAIADAGDPQVAARELRTRIDMTGRDSDGPH
jgi:thiamine-phosphate pyrophosphorylase